MLLRTLVDKLIARNDPLTQQVAEALVSLVNFPNLELVEELTPREIYGEVMTNEYMAEMT